MIKDTVDKYITEAKTNTLRVYHGTIESNVAGIKRKGLVPSVQGDANWFVVCTDIESAIFHSSATETNGAVVFEFHVPVTNERWQGDPIFWPPEKRTAKSIWYALVDKLEPKYIKKIHKISYQKHTDIKNKGF